MTDAALLDHMARLPHARANFKQLIRELGAKGTDRAELETALARLSARGDLLELRSGHYAVTASSREFAVGRLNMHRDGYGFLITDRPREGIAGDIFIPRESAKAAMHGDRVVVRIARIEADGRADGEIVKVLKRAHPTVVGEFRIGRRGQYVVPQDDRIQQWIEIPEGMEFPPAGQAIDRIGVEPPRVSSVAELNGMIVNVELLDYENHEGRVIEILGRPGDFGVDVEIVIRKHHLPHRFPPEAIEQAERISHEIDIQGRRDFRGMDVVTIDGETARDFDDAVWVDRLPNGNYALDVHIADVSHYVQPGTPIDAEARLRGTSVYFPDRAVPMLPFQLSTDICSLVPHADRLVLSALLEIDHQGEVVAQEFTPGVIRSVERMTYTDVHRVLEGDAALRERYQPLVARFELMRELALILNRKRVRRGSIDFDLPEPLIEFDEWGAMTGVTRAPRNMAHRIIEEFMLAANAAVAGSGDVSLYRIHEKPDPKRVMEFEEVATHFGYSLGIGALPVKKFGITARHRDGTKHRREIVVADSGMNIGPRNYQRLVAKIEGKPEERILSYLMLRSLKQARYSTENVGHFALAAEAYTHFTSPIRRYPDLTVHRLLKTRCLKTRCLTERFPVSEVAAIAEECSQSERRAADAERELVEWKKVRFMAERLGEEFDALIISAAKYGVFVELADLFIEGLVPIDTLPGDEYTYHENVRKIVGQRTRREFSIGDRVRVTLDRVDANERKLQFSMVENERDSPRAKRPDSHTRRRVSDGPGKRPRR